MGILYLAAHSTGACLKILLKYMQKTLDITQVKDDNGRTAFHIAATNTSLEGFKILLMTTEDGTLDNSMTQDSIGYTPLHYAVKFGKIYS